jgi:hypothetical protein
MHRYLHLGKFRSFCILHVSKLIKMIVFITFKLKTMETITESVIESGVGWVGMIAQAEADM